MAIAHSAARLSATGQGATENLRRFLLAMAALVAAAVIIGGGTRLTESGLSITEWNVVSGILPPLDPTVWLAEFEKYQHTVQYRQLNVGMTLEQFKAIYLWEWAHRNIGRVIGAVFIAGFAYHGFARTYRFKAPLGLRLLGIGALIGLQGAVGWWMVTSGLFDRVNVAPYRLAIHLTLACFIFACLFATAFQLKAGGIEKTAGRPLVLMLVVIVFVQIFLGALVAGNRAGLVYQTWPSMDGALIPPGLFDMEPLWRNFFENAALVQFLHRGLAYLLLIAAGLNALHVKRTAPPLFPSAFALFLALVGQASLGIFTLLSGVNIVIALCHQAGLLIVLMLALRHYLTQV